MVWLQAYVIQVKTRNNLVTEFTKLFFIYFLYNHFKDDILVKIINLNKYFV